LQQNLSPSADALLAPPSEREHALGSQCRVCGAEKCTHHASGAIRRVVGRREFRRQGVQVSGPCFQTARSVKSRFARHSVYDRWSFASEFFGKSDCSLRLQRKTGEPRPYVPNGPFSTVRFVWENREIRALFAYFGGKRVEFLCSSDCVAERTEFEPSVQV